MRSFTATILVALCATISTTSASIVLPGLQATSLGDLNRRPSYSQHDKDLFSSRSNRRLSLTGNKNAPLAMAIPGYGIGEQIIVGGFGNFLSVYNFIITGRVLLSWFPQAQSIGVLQPVFAITDPYLNLFRGIIPPIFGLDLSPILAFVTLNLLTSATASVGCEIPEEYKVNMKKSRFGRAATRGKALLR
jgi:YggT family protein